MNARNIVRLRPAVPSFAKCSARVVTATRVTNALKQSPATAYFSTGHARRQESSSSNSAPLARPGLVDQTQIEKKQFADYDLGGKVYIITGGARGLGLTLAEALVEAGGKGAVSLRIVNH